MASPALHTCPARPPPAMALTGMGVADSLGLAPVIQRASRTFKCPCIMVLPQPCRPTPGGLGGQITLAAIQGRQSWALVRGLLAGRGQNPLPTYGYSPTTHTPVLSTCPATSEVFSRKTSSQGAALVKGLVVWGGDTVPLASVSEEEGRLGLFYFGFFFLKVLACQCK